MAIKPTPIRHGSSSNGYERCPRNMRGNAIRSGTKTSAPDTMRAATKILNRYQKKKNNNNKNWLINPFRISSLIW